MWGDSHCRNIFLDCDCSLDFILETPNSFPVMKRFIVTSAIISAFVVLSSCEQHHWEDTKKLHVDKAEKHDAHGDAEKSGSDGH